MGEKEYEPGRLDKHLAPIGDFLRQLYVAGGIPLVLIGVGAANLFISYADAQRWVVSIVLISVGTLSWGAALYVALLRWKTQAQIIAEQDALVLKAVCDIARSEKSDVMPDKIRALSEALGGMGVRSLAATDQSDQGSPANSDAPSRGRK